MALRALSTYALASLDQMKRACGVDVDTVQSDASNFLDNLFDSLEWASDEVERFLDRHLVTRGSLTEYHSPCRADPAILYVRQWPISAITSVTEGYWNAGSFVSIQVLTAGTDYIAQNERGKLIRISAGTPYPWYMGFEAVKIVYAGGYASTAVVPNNIRRACLSLAARRFHEVNSQSAGIQSKTDGQGTVTRFLPAELLELEKAALADDKRLRFDTTGRSA